MKLWIVRHGEAGPYQEQDELRELTARGQSDIAALALQLKAYGCNPQQIIVSPYVRTRQTFAVLSSHNAWNASVQISDAIVPEAFVPSVLKVLDDSAQEIMLVSHQPLVSSLIAYLVDGSQRSAMQYPMQPGSVAVLDLSAPMLGAGKLLHLQSPPYA